MAIVHTPPISVVIPTHNTREMAVAAVGSVLENAPATTEILVVDDGSMDGTREALAAFENCVTVIRNRQAQGFAAAANRGLCEARGEVLLVLNSDALLSPEGLGSLFGAFEGDERLGIVGARLVFPDGQPQWSGGAFPTTLWTFVLTSGAARLASLVPAYRRRKRRQHDGSGTVDWVTGAAMAVRRSLWTTIGPFDTEYRFYAQDMDLCRIAAENGWRVRILNDFEVIHHHGATIGRSSEAVDNADPSRLWPDVLRFIHKHDGPEAARRTRRWMLVGARLRIVARSLQSPFKSKGERRQWHRATGCYQTALQHLRRIDLS